MRRLVIAELGAHVLPSAELDWFFNDAEGDMGMPSNQLAILGVEPPRSIEECVEAARHHRRIRERVLSIPDSDAGVLQCAYETRAWPKVLVRRCGHLTGVIVRLACARGRWPSDREEQRALEMARAEWLISDVAVAESTLSKLRTLAQARFARASAAYAATGKPR